MCDGPLRVDILSSFSIRDDFNIYRGKSYRDCLWLNRLDTRGKKFVANKMLERFELEVSHTVEQRMILDRARHIMANNNFKGFIVTIDNEYATAREMGELLELTGNISYKESVFRITPVKI